MRKKYISHCACFTFGQLRMMRTIIRTIPKSSPARQLLLLLTYSYEVQNNEVQE